MSDSIPPRAKYTTKPAATTQSTVSALVVLATANIDIAAFTGRLPGGLQPFVLGGVGFATVTNGQEDDYFGGAFNGSISAAA